MPQSVPVKVPVVPKSTEGSARERERFETALYRTLYPWNPEITRSKSLSNVTRRYVWVRKYAGFNKQVFQNKKVSMK
jgi:hypothetical protein